MEYKRLLASPVQRTWSEYTNALKRTRRSSLLADSKLSCGMARHDGNLDDGGCHYLTVKHRLNLTIQTKTRTCCLKSKNLVCQALDNKKKLREGYLKEWLRRQTRSQAHFQNILLCVVKGDASIVLCITALTGLKEIK